MKLKIIKIQLKNGKKNMLDQTPCEDKKNSDSRPNYTINLLIKLPLLCRIKFCSVLEFYAS